MDRDSIQDDTDGSGEFLDEVKAKTPWNTLHFAQDVLIGVAAVFLVLPLISLSRSGRAISEMRLGVDDLLTSLAGIVGFSIAAAAAHALGIRRKCLLMLGDTDVTLRHVKNWNRMGLLRIPLNSIQEVRLHKPQRSLFGSIELVLGDKTVRLVDVNDTDLLRDYFRSRCPGALREDA